MGQTRHLGILLRDAVLCVDHDEAHIAALDGHGGPQDTVFFDVVVHLGLFPHSGGVDEVILTGLVFKVAVDGVPCGAGHVADDDPLLAQDTVGEGGLAHIGLADDGHLNDVAVLFLLVLRGEVLQAGIQQVAGAVAVDGGHGDGVAQTQIVELIEVRVYGAGGVHLVHCQHDGLLRALEHPGHLLVGGGHAGLDVGNEDDDVGVVDGDLSLLPHEGKDLVVGIGFDTAGIHQAELAAVPIGLSINAVTGDTGSILHDGEAPADDLVEQHGLAHVGPSDDSNQGFGHGYQLLPLSCRLSAGAKRASARSKPSRPTTCTGRSSS